MQHVVPQRTPYDCAAAALATVMRWDYNRAREALGPHTTIAGTCLQPLGMPLLRAGIAATYFMVRDHPSYDAAQATHSDIRYLPTSAEIRAQLPGRRAIVLVEHPLVFSAETRRGHAIAWDGDRAIECGASGDIVRSPSEVDLTKYRILEALILSDAPASPREAPPSVELEAPDETDGADRDVLAAIFERHGKVFLGFSGGKESVALCHLLEPWRDRVTLVWVNTGVMAPHMVDFVRGFRDQGWALIELQSPNVLEHWAAVGTPAEVFPQDNVSGLAEPRLQPWAHCCRTIRQEPINAFLREQDGPVCFINGQRRADRGGATVAGLASHLPPTVEIVMPLAKWTTRELLLYVEYHVLDLPPQYAEGYADSIECIICPAPMKAERLAYLKRRYPAIAPMVLGEAQKSAQATLGALAQLVAITSGAAEAAPPLPDEDAQAEMTV